MKLTYVKEHSKHPIKVTQLKTKVSYTLCTGVVLISIISCSSVRSHKGSLIPPPAPLPLIREEEVSFDLGGGNSLQMIHLKNGLQVVLIEMPGSTVSYGAIAIGVGGRYEPDKWAGISHLLEHLLFKENERARPLTQIRRTGGNVNALTEMELTTYYFTVRPEHFVTSMTALRTLVLEPRFTEEDLKLEREVVLEELAMGKNDPRALAITSLVKKIFPGSPLANLVIGTKKSVKNIDFEELIAFHSAYYVPDNMVVVAAGKIDGQHTGRLIEDLFGGLDRNPLPAAHFSRPEIAVHELEKKIPVRQAFFITGVLTPGRGSDDYSTMRILDTLLGSGLGSRLHRRIVLEEGLTDEIYHFWYPFSDTGVWALFLSMNPEDVETVSRIVWEEFASVREGELTEEDLLLAKKALLSRRHLNLDRPKDLADFEVESLLFRGIVLTVDGHMEELERISREDVVKTAGVYFSPENVVTVEMLPARGISKLYLAMKFLVTKKL